MARNTSATQGLVSPSLFNYEPSNSLPNYCPVSTVTSFSRQSPEIRLQVLRFARLPPPSCLALCSVRREVGALHSCVSVILERFAVACWLMSSACHYFLHLLPRLRMGLVLFGPGLTGETISSCKRLGFNIGVCVVPSDAKTSLKVRGTCISTAGNKRTRLTHLTCLTLYKPRFTLWGNCPGNGLGVLPKAAEDIGAGERADPANPHSVASVRSL